MNSLLLPLPALMVGLLGSVHCLGMCGGLSSAFSFSMGKDIKSSTKLMYQVLYNVGRISTYTILGILAGSLGKLLSVSLGHHGMLILRIMAGLIIVSLGFYMTGWWTGLSKIERTGAALWRRVAPLMKRFMPINKARHAYLIGMIWGFLPCGLVYSTLSLSASSGNPFLGGLTMTLFGIGTLPSMLATGFFAGKVAQFLRQKKIQVYSGMALIGCGSWTMGGMYFMKLFMMVRHM